MSRTTLWCLQYEPERHLLTLRLASSVTAAQMRALVRAHASALASTGGDRFCVLLDLRGLAPLEPDAASLLAQASRAAAALPGFEGRVVLASSITMLAQQRRAGDVRPDDIFTTDEHEALDHLERVSPGR